MDRETVRARFADGDAWFDGAPLYQALARVVAADDGLLDLAATARAGQQPANLLFAATHLLVLRDPTVPMAAWFATVTDDPRDPAEAGPAFRAFCRDHDAALRAILAERLVQTSVVGRGVAVLLALHEVARRVDGPVTLLEVGAGAGLQLRFDRWAVETGSPPRRFGPAGAPVTTRPEWRGGGAPPDLDATAPVADRLGVDLQPVDVTDPEERLWQTALVWPDHRERFTQLEAALAAVAQDPPEIHAGDAVELLPRLDAERLAPDRPLVVWHSMVRIHVPAGRLAAFDAAIAALGERRRLLHVSLEREPGDGPPGVLLRMEDTAGPGADLALVQGHGRWVRPLA